MEDKYLKDVLLKFDNRGEGLDGRFTCSEIKVGGISMKNNSGSVHAQDNHIGVGYTFRNDADNNGEVFAGGDLYRTPGGALALRAQTQVVILSDTFEQFAMPLMKKLGWPTLMCNTLEIADDGHIAGYHMRVADSKLSTVKALHSVGYETIAAGDSFNDLKMIRYGKHGFLFKSTEAIKAANPDVPAFEEFDDLLAAIEEALA